MNRRIPGQSSAFWPSSSRILAFFGRVVFGPISGIPKATHIHISTYFLLFVAFVFQETHVFSKMALGETTTKQKCHLPKCVVVVVSATTAFGWNPRNWNLLKRTGRSFHLMAFSGGTQLSASRQECDKANNCARTLNECE